MKVLNFGSLNYDYVYQVDHIMMPGETQASTDMKTFCGGKGLNQSIALAKAGAKVYHAGAVGEDGQQLLEACSSQGVSVSQVRTVSGKSGHTIIQVSKEGENCIMLYGGANRKQEREHIDQVFQEFEKGDVLLLQNEINQLDYIMEKGYEKEMTIILNPSPFDDHLNVCDLNKISIFLMNEVEGMQITGHEQEAQILENMRKLYPRAKVLLTLGKNGAVFDDGHEYIYQKGIPVKTVDTTAAGDTFTGYFIAGIIRGESMEKVLYHAAKAASIAVSRPGASVSIPWASEVRQAGLEK